MFRIRIRIQEGNSDPQKTEKIGIATKFFSNLRYFFGSWKQIDAFPVVSKLLLTSQVAAFNELGAGEFVSAVFSTSNRSAACSHSTSFLPDQAR